MRKLSGLLNGIALVALLAAPAFAQAPKEYELKINEADVNILGKYLAKGPFEEVAPLMQKLQIQITQQNAPTKPHAVTPPKVEPKKE